MDSYDVVVLGAGISGLAAAKILTKEGLDVIILEARDRPGGRIHTLTLDNYDGVGNKHSPIVDLGANYLHGCVVDQTVQPLFALASKLSIPTAICPGDIINPYRGWECPEIAKWRDHNSGEEIPLEEVVNMTLILNKCLSMVSTVNRPFNNNSQYHLGISLEKCLMSVLQTMHQNNMRMHPCLSDRERGIFDSLLCRYICYINPIDHFPSRYNLVIHDSSMEKSVNHKDCHLETFSQRKYMYLKYFQNKLDILNSKGPQISVPSRPNNRWEDRLVVNGFSKFIDFLVEDLNIAYDSVVKKIDWSTVKQKNGGNNKRLIKITTRDKKTVTCKYCIVTLPVGVLKNLDSRSSVQFVPSLPSIKRKAINNLGISQPGIETHNKVVLQFRPDVIFWERNFPHLECPDPRLHILNLDFYGQPGVLVAHVWAGSGLRLAGRSDEEVVTDLLGLLAGMYSKRCPQGLPNPVRQIVTRWSEDPFSLGSYTYGNITTSDDDRHAYAASLPNKKNPRVLFCGEGTVDSKGAQQCSHGAFLTGVDKAICVLNHLNQGPSRISSIRIVDYLTTKSSKLHPPHSMARRCMHRQLKSPLKIIKKSVIAKQAKLNLKHQKLARLGFDDAQQKQQQSNEHIESESVSFSSII